MLFIFPVLGILGFGLFIAFDKQDNYNKIKQNVVQIEYLRASKRLIIAIEKEKQASLEYIDHKNSLEEFCTKQERSESLINHFKQVVQKLPWKNQWKRQLDDIESDFDLLVEMRNKVLSLKTKNIEIIEQYNELNKKITRTLFLFDKNYANPFQQELLKIGDVFYAPDSIDKLQNIFDFMVFSLNKDIVDAQEQAELERDASFVFLLICILTLFSLFIFLKKVLASKQEYLNEIHRHWHMYKLLNDISKFLIKVENKNDVFIDVCDLLDESKTIPFCFIYDVTNKKLVAKDSMYKDFITQNLDKFNNPLEENLIVKSIKRGLNIVINNFKENKESVFSHKIQDFHVNSMATFAIKKFDKVVGVLAIYSTYVNFFDKEIEVLFDKLILDITNCLEKIDYEDTRKKQATELKIFSYAFEFSTPMIINNAKNEIIKANQAFCKMMEYSNEELMGKNPRIFKTAHQDKVFIDRMWNSLKVSGRWSGEVYDKKATGEIIVLKSTITAIKDTKGKTTHYLGQYIDISEQKDKEKVLEYQATHDNLTGLPNRLLLMDRIEHAITKIVRHNIFGGLIFIDLDNFKEVNDTLGHDIGDALLITVAKKIQECIRNEDTVARIGGDEFIVLLDNIGNNSDEARRNINFLAEKIKDTLNGITHIQGYKNVSTPSIGVTLFKDASINAQDIIKRADTAMYSAKKQGKNTIEFFID